MVVTAGITFTEKWNTDNVLCSEVTVDDQLLKGLKLSFDTQFVPQTGWAFAVMFAVGVARMNCNFRNIHVIIIVITTTTMNTFLCTICPLLEYWASHCKQHMIHIWLLFSMCLMLTIG